MTQHFGPKRVGQMTTGVVQVEDITLELDEGDVWRCLGSHQGAVGTLAEEVARGIAVGLALAEPAALYRPLPLKEIARNRVHCEGGPLLEGQFLAHCFEGASEAVFLVVTIGPALEERVRELFAEGKSVEAFVLDAVGSAAAMNAFGQVANRIFQEAADRGWKAGLCLRPGQSYWDITGQRAVFQVVPAESIGVQLLESCFMVPQKSQSAVIPLGPQLKVYDDHNQSHCRYCNATRCHMRRDFLP